jgi:hypothetical protein
MPHSRSSGTLRAVLLKTVMSWHGALKQTTSEFIYTLCEDQTDEYLRLCGFGAGVGLLAEKGLPGFAHLKEQAHNLDDVFKTGRKL